MPKITIEPTNRGLFQSNGNVVVATGKDLQTLGGNGETIDTTGFYVPVDAGGTARDGTVLEAGTAAGQLLLLLNKGNRDIDFAIAATSNLAGADGSKNLTLTPEKAILCVWDATNSKWSLTSQTLS